MKNSNDETIKIEQNEPVKSQKIAGQKRKSTEANLSDDDHEEDEEEIDKICEKVSKINKDK